MRLNKFVAQATGMSRRGADEAIAQERVYVEGSPGSVGQSVAIGTKVTLDGKIISLPEQKTIVLLHKPAGYVCSRNGQGSKTIYDLLPEKFQRLKPVGRLDKASTGLLLLTDDGDMAQRLTHPSKQKKKVYEIVLDKTLAIEHWRQITSKGVQLEDGPSRFELLRKKIDNKSVANKWIATLYEGRNRQIRRTFGALGYEVLSLHRTQFGLFKLDKIPAGTCKEIENNPIA